jgi:D-alanyl-D-alanine dipeptidase
VDKRFPESRAQLCDLPPVPTFGKSIDTGEYRRIPIDFENPLITEELVDLETYGINGDPFYYISDGSNAPYGQRLDGSIPQLLARKTIAGKLQDVNSRLEPLGFELFVWDAYRPIETQVGIWAFFEDAQKRRNPSFSEEEIYSEVIKYVSDPRQFDEGNPLTWPTHMTGASIDSTIRDKETLELLDMGGAFDQMDDTANSDYFEEALSRNEIGPKHPALLNRRLLYHSMAASEFTNYPLEYWHFDWGNQMHRIVKNYLTGSSGQSAKYGII